MGPGRGSGGGSVVAWSLTITNIDPINFKLIFERFLNPERVSMPDFDIDFCPERRDEVIQHVCDKYGKDKVAQIITFGKLQARAVIRDVGRVLGMPYGQVDKISKMIPHNPNKPVTLQEAIDQDSGFSEAIANDSEVKKLTDIALQLEGLYRHASTHAAGVVIGYQSLENIVPLYKDYKSPLPATQFSMKFVELIGLVKFDFLGLKTLTIIQTAITLIKNHKNKVIEIDSIPLNDTDTFNILQKCETVGIFQLESPGMKDVLRKLQPTYLEEIIALVALYRPGPMDDIPRYIACKNKEQKVTYVHPTVENILEETYGVMVYQEQVMQIAQKLAGYSLGQADLLRRAMGKKIKSEMDAQREVFVNGCIKISKMQKVKASELFDQIAKFASYAFPKGHAVPYGLIAYQTAYLKANYPVEFLTSMMTHDINNTDKLSIMREELNRLKIPLLSQDINKSFSKFSIEKNSIRYALCGLKNVGESATELIVQERQKSGDFVSIIDFIRRLDSKAVNKRMLENLISAGAFDNLHETRSQLFNAVNLIMKYQGEKIKLENSDQGSLFMNNNHVNLPEITIPKSTTWNQLEQAQHEFSAIGFYLGEHPILSYVKSGAANNVTEYKKLCETLKENQEIPVNLAGVIIGKTERVSRNGKKYAFVQISDASGLFEGIIFNDTYMKCRDCLEIGTLVSLTANAKNKNSEISLIINYINKLNINGSNQVEFQVNNDKDLDMIYNKQHKTENILLKIRTKESMVTIKSKVL